MFPQPTNITPDLTPDLSQSLIDRKRCLSINQILHQSNRHRCICRLKCLSSQRILQQSYRNHCIFALQVIDCLAELKESLRSRTAFRFTGHWLSCGINGITAFPHCFSLYRPLIVMRNWWNHCAPALLFAIQVIDCHAELKESLRSRNAFRSTGNWLSCGINGITAFPHCFSLDRSLIVMLN